MDANTKDVLMSVIALISAVVTPIVVVYVGKQNAVKITGKVEEYHKEVNGKMGMLLETTKELATANEKARAKGEKK